MQKKTAAQQLEAYIFPLTIIISCIALLFTSRYSYLLFHFLIELFTAVIAFGIFIIAWSSRRYIDNNFLLIIGIGFFFIGNVDLVHTLSYRGMLIISNQSADPPTQLWIIARYLEAFTFLGALLFLREDRRSGIRNLTSKPALIFLSYGLIFVLTLLSVFYWKNFPTTYVEGSGLTAFKKISEYVISALFLVSIFLLFKKSRLFDSKIANLISLALIMKIASELSFSEYVGVYDFSNMLGHLFKFISFALLYYAVINIGLMEPYRLLFFDLKRNQKKFHLAQNELQKRIEEHLHEAYKQLGVANRKISLLLEIEEHSQTKKNRDEIIKYIVDLAEQASHAKTALLYASEGSGIFSLISGNGLSEETAGKISKISSRKEAFLKNLIENKKRINAPFASYDIKHFDNGDDLRYFVALPLIHEEKCKGFLFLGFKRRTSMETQELEFLDVFSVHASSALSRLGVIK